MEPVQVRDRQRRQRLALAISSIAESSMVAL
jgi:hypothetical protein